MLMATRLVVFVHLLGLGLGLNTLPEHLIASGFAPSTIGKIISLFSIGQLIGGPALVALSRRFGRLQVLQASLCVAVLSQWGTAVSSTAVQFAATRGILGVAAAVAPVAQGVVADLVPPAERTRAIGSVMAASSLGIVVGPSAATLFDMLCAAARVPSSQRFRVIYYISTCVFLTAAFTTKVLLPGGGKTVNMNAAPHVLSARPHASSVPTSPATSKGGLHRTDGPTRAQRTRALARSELWRQWLLRYVAFVARWKLLAGFLFYGLFVQRFLGYGKVQFGAALSSSAAGSILIQLFVLPRLCARLGEHGSCALGLSLIAVAFGGCGAVRTQPMHCLLFLASRSGLAIVDTTCASLVARYSASSAAQRDRHLALVQMTQACSSIVAPLVGAPLYEASLKWRRFPGAAVFALTSLLALTAVPLPLLLRATDERYDRALERA